MQTLAGVERRIELRTCQLFSIQCTLWIQRADTSQAKASLNVEIMLFKLRPWQRAHVSACRGGKKENIIINTTNPPMQSDAFHVSSL